MKKLIARKWNQKGFTLIELMIVVGIIGILVALAAPNFSRYQSKARQSEGKIALAAIFTGEKSFHSEYAAYLASFDAIGYEPEGNKRFYTSGWAASQGASAVTGYSGSVGTPSYTRVNFPSSWTTCTPALGQIPAVATVDAQTFTATVSGQIRDGVDCDVWTMDDTKVLTNTTVNL